MSYVESGLIPSVWATALLVVFWMAAFSLGRAILNLVVPLRRLAASEEVWLVSSGLGITLISLIVLWMGLIGQLDAGRVAAVIICFALGSFFAVRGPSMCSGLPKNTALMILILAPLALSWLQSVMPATGTDALAYHLYHPKEFVLKHRVYAMPFETNRESLWPYQTEMLFALGLLLQGSALAQLFHWMFYPMTAWAVYLLARRFYGVKCASFAAITFLFTPAAFAQSGYAYVDLSLAFFVFLSVYLFLRWDEDQEWQWLALSGFFCGAAIGTKYLGLGCFGLLAVMTAFRSRFRIQSILIFVLASIAVGGVWYIRSWWVTGNPVYPFFSHIFPGKGIWATPLEIVDAAGGSRGEIFDIGIVWRAKQGISHFLMLLWNLTLDPAPHGGELLGPLFLMFLPFLGFKLHRISKASAYLMIFSVGYTYFIFSQSQYTRFFLSCATFWSVGVGIVLNRLMNDRSKILKTAALSVFLVTIFMHMGIFIHRSKDQWAVWVGKQSASDYLAQHERSFKAHTYLKEHVKPGDSLFVSSEVTYFYNEVENVVWDNLFLRNLLQQQKSSLSDYLKERRFRYFWLAYYDDVYPDGPIMDIVHSSDYELVYSYDFTESPATYHNFIYKLKS